MSIPAAAFPFTLADNGTLWCCGMPGCTKTIPTAKKSLVVYHRNTHFPSYTCPTCNERFPQKNRLDVHIRTTHTGEKPYSCEHCDRAFPQLSNLQDHVRKHHGDCTTQCKPSSGVANSPSGELPPQGMSGVRGSPAAKAAKQLAAFRAKETEWIRLEHPDWTPQQIGTELFRRWRLVNSVQTVN